MNYLILECHGEAMSEYLTATDVVVDKIGGTWNNEYYTLPTGIYIISLTPNNITDTMYMSGRFLNVKENGTILRTIQSAATTTNNSSLVDVLIVTEGTQIEIAFHMVSSCSCNISARVVQLSSSIA